MKQIGKTIKKAVESLMVRRLLPIKHVKNSIVIRRGKRRKYGEIHITKILKDLLEQFIPVVRPPEARSWYQLAI